MIDVQKKSGDWGPLMWEYDEGTMGSRKIINIFLSCAHVELHLGRLNAHHIAADGTVSPSVLFQPCGWHEFVKLIGWNQGEYNGTEAA